MSRRWKSVLIAAAAILTPIAVATIWVQAVAARRWAETLKRTEEIEGELAAPLPGRRPLRGEPLPGNAWDDYAAARPASTGLSTDDHTLEIFLLRRPAADPGKVRAIVATLRPQIDLLRRGASRRDAVAGPGASVSIIVFKAALASARFLAEEGRSTEALPLLADLHRAALDQAGHAESVGRSMAYAMAFRAVDELLRILGAGGATPEALKELARELSVLEASIPKAGRFFLFERVETAKQARDHGAFGFGLVHAGLRWRYAYSSRLFLAASLAQMEAWGRELERLDGGSWDRVRALQEAAVVEADRTGNAYLKMQTSLFQVEMYAWILRARLRLARAGALFRATGEKAPIEDPFGGTLQWDQEGVRSRGPTEDPKDDIVLRLKR